MIITLGLSALTFFLLRQKESNKEKGDFFWIAPRKKRVYTLGAQSYGQRHGAGILPRRWGY